jgi:hypothetical protein
MIRFSVLWLSLIIFTPCYAQLTLQTAKVNQLSGVNSLLSVGDVVLVQNVDELEGIKLQPAVMIKVTTDAANVEVDVTDSERRRVEYVKLEEKEGTSLYLVSTPGKFWVDVTVIDFERNIYKREWDVFEVEKGTPIGPSPTPLPEPSVQLQQLVAPITPKVTQDKERASIISATFQGFAEGVKVLMPRDIDTFSKVNRAAIQTLSLPPGISIGAEVDKVLTTHVGIQTKDGQWLDRTLTEQDRTAIIEAYQAIAWSCVQ